MDGFALLCCAVGIEPLLKADIAARWPSWRLAFSRPGLVTFKLAADLDPAAPAPTPFARVWARSLGKRAVTDLTDLPAHDRAHVFARDPAGEAPAAAYVTDNRPAAIGERVLDIVIAPDEPAWLGLHVHGAFRSPHPGGAIPVDIPADAPSRAYAKIEEAIAWAQLAPAPGDVALDLGSAPGGAALALVRRGVHVIAVDTAALDPVVLAARHPSGARVDHRPITMGALRWEDLPPRIDWLLCDVHLAPQVALHELARLAPRLRPTLRGAVITLKLNEPRFVSELPRLTDRIRALGLPEVHLTHLPSNRRELCAVALPTGAPPDRP